MRMNLDDVASSYFVLGRDILCEFNYWPLAVESLINTRTLKKRCALAARTEVKQTQEL